MSDDFLRLLSILSPSLTRKPGVGVEEYIKKKMPKFLRMQFRLPNAFIGSCF